MAIEIVDFPMNNGGSFQFAMLNYQRVEVPKFDNPMTSFFKLCFARIGGIVSASPRETGWKIRFAAFSWASKPKKGFRIAYQAKIRWG